MKKLLLAGASVAMLLAFGAGCSDDSSNPADSGSGPPSGGNVVSMKNNFFTPKDLTVTVGDTVTWVNEGTVQHTSTSGSPGTFDGKWDSGLLSPGQSFKHVFTSEGAFLYFCRPHWSIGMTGSITVTP